MSEWNQQVDWEEFDSEDGADGELPSSEGFLGHYRGIINNSVWSLGGSKDNYMAAELGDQTRLWYSDWEQRHPDCSREDFELRVFHNTPDEQYLALHCGKCGKTVDPAEIINALIVAATNHQQS